MLNETTHQKVCQSGPMEKLASDSVNGATHNNTSDDTTQAWSKYVSRLRSVNIHVTVGSPIDTTTASLGLGCAVNGSLHLAWQ